MKQIKLVLKRILIVYVVLFITFSQMSSSFARKYDAQCGEYVSKYARDFIAKYCAGKSTVYDASTGYAFFTGGSIGKGTFHACCSSGVHLMYKEALGVDIYKYGFNALCSTAQSQMLHSSNWERVLASDLKPGDILISGSHTEMYIGNHQNANFGNSPRSGKISGGPRLGSDFNYAFRPTFDVNPTGSVPKGASYEEERKSIYDENGFIYSGVAKIEGYKSSYSYGKWIIKSLAEIFDYFIGMATLILRIVLVGWTALIERFVTDGIVNAVTGITNKKDENWDKDPSTLDEVDKELMEEEQKQEEENQEEQNQEEENQETGPKATGEENEPNEYISEGMQRVSDIGGKVQLKTSSKANVTVENIVYNKIPILDINFFNFESAGGAVVDEDGIIYLLKENIAMWYYIFRTLAIVAMLAVLIYLGIRMAISTVAEKKAIYKQMLLSWVVGFILVFLIHYVMYIIIYMNESFLSWIVPQYENGSEISLYETVRSKAYEVKASTGFAGLIMYIILVYYGIRFLLVYFRRYLVITILALLSPIISVYYAVQRINGKGRGGQALINWFKDFLYSVWIQSIHALIYTIFVKTALELSETSLLGIVIAFFFLSFMIKVDKVVRDIFGLGGTNSGDLVVGTIGTQLAVAGYVKGAVKKVGGKYGNYLGKTVKPVAAIGGKIGNAYNAAKIDMLKKWGMTEEEAEETIKEREKEKEKRKEERAKLLNEITAGLKIGTGIAATALKGALVLPIMIVEPVAGVQLLNSTIVSAQKVKETIEKAKENKILPTSLKGSFKLKGILPKNKKSAEALKGKFDALNVPYREVEIPDSFDKSSPHESSNSQASKYYKPVLPPVQTDNYSKNESKQFEQKDIVTSKGVVGKIERTIENGEIVETKIHLDKKAVADLDEDGKTELAEQLSKEDLQFAQIDKASSEIIEELIQEGDIEKIEAISEIIQEAKEKEKDLEKIYNEVTGKIDNQIDEMKNINPEFAAILQKKRAKELSKVAYMMSQPLSEKDIFRAIQNYQSKVPQFSPDQERFSSEDIKGITTELNEVLAKKGLQVEMSKEFIKKAEKELTEQHRRDKAKKESMAAQAEARRSVGSDVSNKTDQKSAKEKTKRLRERIREFQGNGFNNLNAPKPNGGDEGKSHSSNDLGTSSTDRLVKKLQNSSKGTKSKTPLAKSGISSKTIEFSSKLDELLELSREVEAITGEKFYSIEDILKRLEEI